MLLRRDARDANHIGDVKVYMRLAKKRADSQVQVEVVSTVVCFSFVPLQTVKRRTAALLPLIKPQLIIIIIIIIISIIIIKFLH